MDPRQIRLECLSKAVHTPMISPNEIVGQAGAYEAFITGKENSVAKKAKKPKKVAKKAKKAKK